MAETLVGMFFIAFGLQGLGVVHLPEWVVPGLALLVGVVWLVGLIKR